MSIFFRHYVCRAFHKTGPEIEKALDPVLDLGREQQIYLNLWSIDILSISALSQPDMQVGCLLGFEKLLYIF